jgi:hypothetical protein
VKQFIQTFNCVTNAAGVISSLQGNFSQYANYTGPFNTVVGPASASVQFGNTPVAPGNQISISEKAVVFVGGAAPVPQPPVNVSVTVVSSSTTGFTFSTDPGHVLYPATISFAATNPENGQVTFSININGQFANKTDEALYYFGGSSLENSIWSNLIANVKALCNGTK